METHLAEWLAGTADGEEAESILRKCVHCGFCTATCPTFQLLGDELDSPRGRIYLMKQVVEGHEPTQSTLTHLDRCLTCRNCETTCPSGVQYGHLVDIGRKIVESKVKRPLGQRLVRTALREGLTRHWLFDPAMRVGRALRPALPAALRDKVPLAPPARPWPTASHARRVLLLNGCVQPAMLPNVDAATARVLDRLGVQSLVDKRAGCCGAIRHHLNDGPGALDEIRRNIDVWWPYLRGDANGQTGVDGGVGADAVPNARVGAGVGPGSGAGADAGAGAEALVINASGCGAMIKDYGHLLRNDPKYAERAARVSAMTLDLAEWLPAEMPKLQQLLAASSSATTAKVAFHPPCTLQHGQQVRGVVEAMLSSIGATLTPVPDNHLCCGSAGTYSVLQPELATRLRERKIDALQSGDPQVILSANVGCLTHLQAGTAVPVRHWIEWLDDLLEARAAS